MVKITPFEVEQWMDRYETTPGVINIAETCCASISVNDLISLNTDKSLPSPLQLSKKLTYGDILGSSTLRSRVASLLNRDLNLYSPDGDLEPLTAENVIITQGAIAANFLVFYTLVGPGDHVISVYPTYQQLYSVPESLGAEVSLWKLKAEKGYVPDVEVLEGLVKDNTKLLVLNNPNNPTGATIPTSTLQSILGFCSSRNITILSDEVYSPLFHSLPNQSSPSPPSILSLSPSGTHKTCTTLSTGSTSKSLALAGLRLGWIASRSPSLLRAIASARDYTAISVSQLDDQVASYALGPTVLPALLERNLGLARTNLTLLTEFVEGKYGKVCSWVRPTAGTTALVQFRKLREGGEPVDDAAFVLDVLEKTNVLFMPGSPCFGLGKDFKGYVRIGYACETEVLKSGLELLGQYVEQHLL
ncbi:pyridoxal phosphate-dependent transferase [Pseudoneurospora amorphoporcata]|uniref:Pyridoxal phosphate-dependent transferase n=1 Tax=Pseudoneurospora amorphoporcata TaxID=241081 RepID=A0AAN6P3X3_9PEZI|nr:pyridoxal phosphate-dependent transferase [Pseudoneurospora amorphoporcata]